MHSNNEIQIYTSHNGEIELQVTLEAETVWLTQADMIRLFWRNQSVISRHINNIFSEWELDEKSNMHFLHIAHSDKPVKTYSLDVVISVGYRVKSLEGTRFRIWANQIIKQYLLEGYAINKKRIEEKWFAELEQTLHIFRKTLESQNLTSDDALWLLDIITKYTNSWLLLQKYDENDLKEDGKTPVLNYRLEASEAYEGLRELKRDLIAKGQATELFANPREHEVLEGIFGNIYQTFGGEELYTTIEEKAANLLYFIVKNHPFSDGNKRSGAFLFIVFLAKNHILFDSSGERKINDRALVAITLLIAESDPKDKDIMVRLVMNLIV